MAVSSGVVEDAGKCAIVGWSGACDCYWCRASSNERSAGHAATGEAGTVPVTAQLAPTVRASESLAVAVPDFGGPR